MLVYKEILLEDPGPPPEPSMFITYENLEKLVTQRIVHGVTFLWIHYEQLRDEIFWCVYCEPLKRNRSTILKMCAG